MSHGQDGGASLPRRGAGWLAERGALPTAVRAVVGYYAKSGVVDLRALRLKGRVEDAVGGIVDDAFAAVEAELAEEFGVASAAFDYETKLTLPVELTLGYLYRAADDEAGRRDAEGVARLVTEALLDGDMRDAINDGEYGDFAYDLGSADPGPERVAAVAQACLRERVEAGFAAYPDGVRDAYEWAVAVSERHQADDDRFRELLAAALDGDGAARERIEAEYRHAEFRVAAGDGGGGEGAADVGGGEGAADAGGAGGDGSAVGAPEGDPPAAPDPIASGPVEVALGERERALPYARTQYERVGVIYDGMIGMFRAAGLEIPESFQRSVVLAIVGAQVWLDDVDDFREDMAEGQLTPVTAEYLLAADERAAYDAVVEVTRQYLDAAIAYATESDSPLTGIAAEYIYRTGEPEALPGSY